jgi:hypothetical protein
MHTDYRTRARKRLLGLLIATFPLAICIFGLWLGAALGQQHAYGPDVVSASNASSVTLTAGTPTTVASVTPVYNPRAQGNEELVCIALAEVDTGASASTASAQITSTLGNSSSENFSIPATSKATLHTIVAVTMSQAQSGTTIYLKVTDSNADTVPASGGTIICAGFAQ